MSNYRNQRIVLFFFNDLFNTNSHNARDGGMKHISTWPIAENLQENVDLICDYADSYIYI
jgi:hypothetical protein